MDQFPVGSVVWASARGDIFWPGQVIESEDAAPVPAKKFVTINFLIEDSYENIKSLSRIFTWNCKKQDKFIQKGRALKNEEKRVQFNKAVAEADYLFSMKDAEKGATDLCRDEASDESRKGSNKKNRKNEITQDLRCEDRLIVQKSSKYERKLDTAKTNKEKQTLKRSCPTNKLQTKRSLKCDVKRQKTLQRQSNNLTSEDGETGDHSQVCSRHQKLLKTKRKFLENGPGYEKRVSPKKRKPCDQVVPGNNQDKTGKNKKSVELLDMKTSTSSDGSLVEHAAFGITSNSSVTSDGSSDDELLSEAFSPSQEANEFTIGDIIWAKYYREPYWPALIKKVTGKRKQDQKFVVKFLGWNKGLFKIQPKKLEHFACDSNLRAEFMDIKYTLNNKEMEEKFDEAVTQAEDLLNRKGLGKSLDDELDAELDGDVHIFDEIEEKDAEEHVGDLQMKNKDLLQTPDGSERRKSNRTKRQVSKYSDILSYIRQAKSTLKQILDGKRQSERHTTFTRGRVSEKNQLKHRAGFGPVGDEKLQDEIMHLLVEFHKEFKGNVADISYVSDVWLPEAIIWSIQEIDHVDKERAEKTFLEGSGFAVTNAEVEQLTSNLKQRRKLSTEEAEERIKKAERAMAS